MLGHRRAPPGQALRQTARQYHTRANGGMPLRHHLPIMKTVPRASMRQFFRKISQSHKNLSIIHDSTTSKISGWCV